VSVGIGEDEGGSWESRQLNGRGAVFAASNGGYDGSDAGNGGGKWEGGSSGGSSPSWEEHLMPVGRSHSFVSVLGEAVYGCGCV